MRTLKLSLNYSTILCSNEIIMKRYFKTSKLDSKVKVKVFWQYSFVYFCVKINFGTCNILERYIFALNRVLSKSYFDFIANFYRYTTKKFLFLFPS